jgi:hypothetical protein
MLLNINTNTHSKYWYSITRIHGITSQETANLRLDKQSCRLGHTVKIQFLVTMGSVAV